MSNYVCLTISKRYEREHQPYWYAYHPDWHAFLEAADQGTFILGCMDRTDAFAVPFAVMKEFLPKLNQTRREDGKSYWHVVITKTTGTELALYSSPTGEKIDLSPYAFSLEG